MSAEGYDRAPGNLPRKRRRVCPSRKKQSVESVVALFVMLSILPEMPLGELIGLASIKMKGTNMKERPWSLDATDCNDVVLSKFIGCWSDSEPPWMLSMLSEGRDCEQ